MAKVFTLKTIIVVITFLFLFTTRVLSQSKCLYFKATKAYVLLRNATKLTEPMETDDVVLFDVTHDQIIIVSSTAQVYRIVSGDVKYANNGNPYIEYTVNDVKGNKALITYTEIHDASTAQTIRVIINDYQNPMTVLDGSKRQVY